MVFFVKLLEFGIGYLYVFAQVYVATISVAVGGRWCTSGSAFTARVECVICVLPAGDIPWCYL